MPRLKTLTLRASDPAAQRQFYCNVLGMSNRGNGRVGYADEEAALRFVAADAPYTPQSSDLYWKIGLSLPNIDLAYTQLRALEVPCSTPAQFRDVGYLAKAMDPEGFTIELIDHWFQGDRPRGPVDDARLGGGAHLNLITLRTADIADVHPVVVSLGMTPLSVQPVEPYGFTLYFYAFTDETPPNPDLQAIENRTWVYQRPYSVLEIQHAPSLEAETLPKGNAGGYGGMTIGSAETDFYFERLMIKAGETDIEIRHP